MSLGPTPDQALSGEQEYLIRLRLLNQLIHPGSLFGYCK